MRADGCISIKKRLLGFCPYVMEKILLRIAGMRAEMRGSKATEPLPARAAAWKVEFLQSALNPHVHRERRVETVGEQQHAVGYLFAYAAQGH